MDILPHHQIKKMEKIDLADARNRTHDQNFTKRSQHPEIKKYEEKIFLAIPISGIEPTTNHFKADAEMT